MNDPSPHFQPLRQYARIALYASFVLVGLIAAAIWPVVNHRLGFAVYDWASDNLDEREEIQLLQELIRIDTTPQTGHEIEAARYLATWLAQYGISSEIEEPAPTKANLWALIEGDDPRPLVLLSHLDTDPLNEEEQWQHPPFGGNLVGPWVVGRGAFDMKCLTVAQLLAMRAAQQKASQTGRRPARSLLFVATSSEETGSDLGARRLLATRPEWIRTFWAVLTEGGVVEALDIDTVKYWGTSFAQDVTLWGLASHPDRAALEELESLLKERTESSPLRVSQPVREFLHAYAETRKHPEYRAALADPDALVGDRPRFEKLTPFLKALFRDEASLGEIVHDPTTGIHRAPIYIRLLPGSEIEPEFLRFLPKDDQSRFSIAMEPFPESDNIASPLDHPVMRAIDDLLARRRPDAVVGPYFLATAANDCRFFAPAGTPCYGFWPFPAAVDSFTISQADERIFAPAFLRGVELHSELIDSLIWPQGAGQ